MLQSAQANKLIALAASLAGRTGDLSPAASLAIDRPRCTQAILRENAVLSPWPFHAALLQARQPALVVRR